MTNQPIQSDKSGIAQLQALGAQIRARRKALRLNATLTAEAAGMSRVTLHRIEKGEPSVTMGAWSNALAALGMSLQANHRAADESKRTAAQPDRTGWIPARVSLSEYPQLRALAWRVHGTDTLTPTRGTGHIRTQRPPSGCARHVRRRAGTAAGPAHNFQPCSLTAPTTSALLMC